MTHRLLAILLAGVVAAGCKKDPPKDDVPAKPEKEKDEPKKEKKKEKPAFVTEAGRRAPCEFVEWKGTGKDKKAMFKIKAPKDKKISSVQTWIFYYDKAGKYLSRYPHATSVEDGPQRLGSEGDSIAKGTDVVECEVTRINYDDETKWINANLLPDGDRPKGGVTDAYLKEHSGEKVEVDVVDAKTGKLKLKNISDKPVKNLRVEIDYIKEKGHESRSDFVTLAIKPGETVEHTLKLDKPPPDPFKSAEAYAYMVTFEDDTKFTNKNLSAFER
jgi:hypothetical protein